MSQTLDLISFLAGGLLVAGLVLIRTVTYQIRHYMQYRQFLPDPITRKDMENLRAELDMTRQRLSETAAELTRFKKEHENTIAKLIDKL